MCSVNRLSLGSFGRGVKLYFKAMLPDLSVRSERSICPLCRILMLGMSSSVAVLK